MDASFKEQNQAACGGVLRDPEGRWKVGFCQRLGSYSIALAELLAIKTGIEVCVTLGIFDMQIFTDSLDKLATLTRGSSNGHPFRDEIEGTRERIYGIGRKDVLHCSRNLMMCADK